MITHFAPVICDRGGTNFHRRVVVVLAFVRGVTKIHVRKSVGSSAEGGARGCATVIYRQYIRNENP